MQSGKFSANIIRYIVVIFFVGYFRRELNISFYGMSLAEQITELTSFQTYVLKTTGLVLPLLIVFVGGICADKYGRKVTWAASLFLYGGGVLSLGAFNLSDPAPPYFVPFTSFGSALAAAVLYSIPPAFIVSSLAWIFDYEGKDGIKNARGVLHILSALSILVAMIMLYPGGFLNERIQFMLSGVIALVAGRFVMTFPENYGNRSTFVREIVRTGVNQFISRRVLQALVIYSIVIGFSLQVYSLSFSHFLEVQGSPETFISVSLYSNYIFAAGSLLAGIFILLMKKVDYKKLIIYPLALTVVLYILLSLPPTTLQFLMVRGGFSALYLLIGTGIVILANDSISENRATTLSILTMLMAIPTFLEPFWDTILTILAWEMACVIAGAVAFLSAVYLYEAVKHHEQNTRSIEE